jgi:hypothetical protein
MSQALLRRNGLIARNRSSKPGGGVFGDLERRGEIETCTRDLIRYGRWRLGVDTRRWRLGMGYAAMETWDGIRGDEDLGWAMEMGDGGGGIPQR